MTALEHVFVGVILTGIGLTAKVVIEGLRHIGLLHERMVQFRRITLEFKAKAAKDATQVATLEDGIEDLTMDVKALEEKVEKAVRKTELLQSRFEKPDATKHKVEMQE